MIDVFATHLLRRHVANRPQHRARIGLNFSRRDIGLRQAFTNWLDELCYAEVKNFEAIVLRDEEIVRLQAEFCAEGDHRDHFKSLIKTTSRCSGPRESASHLPSVDQS